MRSENLLTDVQVRNAKPGDKLSDGGGLYLLVKPSGAKLWQYRFKILGQESTHAIGEYHPTALSLREARRRRNTARDLVSQGFNPNTVRKEERQRIAQEELLKKTNTFKAAYERWLAATEQGVDLKTISQRRREIERYAKSIFSHSVDKITRKNIVEILEPLEKNIPEVARNMRQYFMAIFELLIDDGVLASNPCPVRRNIKRGPVRHHPAIFEDAIVHFMRCLEQDKTSDFKSIVATKLVMLTVCRKSEATSARWDEFNLENCEWFIPATRMKTGVAHWIPLSTQVVALLKEWHCYSNGSTPYVFPNRRDPTKPMAGNTLNAIMNRHGLRGKGTPHGLRSGFSTYFNKRNESRDAIERCLAHEPSNKIRAAYNRWDYAPERRRLLQLWANYLLPNE
ncbi:tyrosine-type recombinase/integrase [Laribacter hongkongensis]|uniref:tyrosine-type recombinase/integrase n=1 Tax=Laribacter hongkongensis TaxID=168471 RepID=UPI001EFD974D|nr:integrase arm-type DNA-binding domain-containing protein [Laribacter hongkongensis]MCG9031189.1 tyrosine-type recombinase/integrase [Laribacter hongkongensis]MCG9092510.1 tyrosine-type recombinase/integrase [Laribacter hongkongensis]